MTATDESAARFPGGRVGWWCCVAAAVAVAASRAPAAWFSYGLDGYADEPAVVDPALAAARGVLRPEEFLYPGWTAYTLGALYKLLDLLGFASQSGGILSDAAGADRLVVGRLFVLAVSTATVVVTALIGRRVAGAWCAAAAAALLVCSPLFTSMSYVVTVNPPASLWTACATLFALRVVQEGRRPRDYVLAAICAGLAVACKYNSYPACLALVLAHFLGPRGADGMRHRWLAWSALIAPLTFFAATPYALIDAERFVLAVRFLGDVYEKDWPLHYNESGTSWLDYAERMARSGWPNEMFAAAALGSMAMFARDARRASIVIIAPLLNFVFLGFYAVFFLRHLVPALPALAVASGAAVQWCADRVARRSSPGRSVAVASSVAALLIAGVGARAMVESHSKAERAELQDARAAAFEWIEANLPAGARIVREDRTPEVESSSKGFDVLFIRCIAQPDRTREVETYDYLVTSGMMDRLMRDPMFEEGRRVYAEFFARHELVREFKGNGVEYAGRDIRIFRIDRAAAAARADEAR
jgi:hypothetical protein